MSVPDDGHSPKICNWQHCGNPSAELPCPFTKDPSPAESLKRVFNKPDDWVTPVSNMPGQCKHEWRQYWDLWGESQSLPNGFYCIHCRKIEKDAA